MAQHVQHNTSCGFVMSIYGFPGKFPGPAPFEAEKKESEKPMQTRKNVRVSWKTMANVG